MQRIIFILLLTMISYSGLAQWQYDTAVDGNRRAVMAAKERDALDAQGLRQTPWFFGGGLVAGFSSYGSAFGLSPLAGYKLNDYVDAGLGLNLIYNSSKPRDWNGNQTDYKSRAFNFEIMPFVRAFPINNVFAQLQFEQAWVNGNIISGGQKTKFNYDYQSLIASLGYAQRMGGRVGFYFSVGIDLLKDPYSPYRDNHGRVKPVFSTGINF